MQTETPELPPQEFPQASAQQVERIAREVVHFRRTFLAELYEAHPKNVALHKAIAQYVSLHAGDVEPSVDVALNIAAEYAVMATVLDYVNAPEPERRYQVEKSVARLTEQLTTTMVEMYSTLNMV